VRIAAGNIFLEQMRFYAYHGVMEQERLVGGYYLVTLTAEADLTAAVQSDDVADTVNYASLYALVEREMDIPSRLLEHVAGRIGRRVLEEFDRITALTVRVVKENPPMGADSRGAGVEVKFKR
jgi:dihydroneopterin aldolase